MAGTTLDQLAKPDTGASAAALAMASAYFSPTMLNHSLRVDVWAAARGTAQDIRLDPELLYVASLFHDFGLVPEFDSHTISFEKAGGNVAGVFAAGAGWSAEGRERLSKLIFGHIWGDRAEVSMDPKGSSWARSSGVEITGRHADDFTPGFRAEVLQRYPPAQLHRGVPGLLHDQAERKPDGPPAASMRNDLDARMAGNPLDDSSLRSPAGD